MDFVPGLGARKVRKGKVGAGLPFEPWNKPNSSEETSSIWQEEEDGTVTGCEGGEKSLPPFPTLVMESASTSGHELKWDQDHPPTPPPKSLVFTPSPQVHAHIVTDMPLSPPGSGDSEGGISSLAASQASLLVPPPPPSPPQLILRLAMHTMSPSTDIGATIDLAPVSSDVGLDVTHIRDPKISSLNSKETLEVGLDSHHFSNAVSALGRDDDVQAYTTTFDDDSYDDVDQFMDQFMEHYDRVDPEEDELDDTTRLGQEALGQKEYDDVMPIDKRVVDDDNGMPMPIPLRPQSTPLMALVGDQSIVTSNRRLNAALNGHARNGEEPVIAIVTPDPLSLATTPPPLPTTSLTTAAMTLPTPHTLLEDGLTCESSTAVAAALATSMWKQDPCELAEDLSSSTHRSNGSAVSRAIHPGVNVHHRTQLSSTSSISSTRNPSFRFPIASDESESSESESEDEDDDIPLAKSIPGALTAQTTIRRQVRQEKENKKQEKLRRLAETTRTRLTRLPDAAPSSLSSSRGDTSSQPQQVGRSRNRTLRAPVSRTALYPQEQLELHPRHRSKSMTRSLGDTLPTETLPPLPQAGSSMSHAQRTNSMKEPSSSYRYNSHSSPTPIPAPYHHRSLSRSRNSLERMRISDATPSIPGRMSYDDHKLSKSQSSSSRSGIRMSADGDKPQRAASATWHRNRQVPVPVPSTTSLANPSPVTNASKAEVVVQQRVFISSMQRFNMVEIGESTTAGDVIRMIEAEGSLKDLSGSGGWMVFEVAQDFGMERPIRSFEIVVDVQASWNKDKMVNYLVLRMTPLDLPLNRSAIPSSSPTHSGYIEWEAKRGKWCKRFLQLREHGIWLSKRDNCQDQVQLCSLSNFDAYQVTRTHRAPKPFAFAVKSTDKLSFFENTADYLHSFACSEKDGNIWMEKILVARSYVLFQERHVLFNPRVVNGNASVVSRSATRKATIQRPVFEPGSLLSKRL